MGSEFYDTSYPEHNLGSRRLTFWVALPFDHMDLSPAGGALENFKLGTLFLRSGGSTSYNYLKRSVHKRPVDH